MDRHIKNIQFSLNVIMDGYLNNFVDYDPIKVWVEFSYSEYQETYGQDADGNRGQMRTYFDSLEIKITGCELVKPELEHANKILEKWFDKNWREL